MEMLLFFSFQGHFVNSKNWHAQGVSRFSLVDEVGGKSAIAIAIQYVQHIDFRVNILIWSFSPIPDTLIDFGQYIEHICGVLPISLRD